MSEDERILRLENAISTLAELAAKQQRLSEEQQRQAAEQQRQAVEQRQFVAEQQRLIVDLQRRTAHHDESIDGLKAARVESEQKQAELATTVNELAAKMDDLANTMKELAVAMTEMAEAQAHADRRVDALVDIMRDWRNGRG